MSPAATDRPPSSGRPDLLPPIPVTVLGGFLGAGKTTIVNDLLRALADRRVAVVVNDFGEIDIDGGLIAAVHDDVMTLTNGCICCSIRDSVASTVMRLAERSDRPDHVVIEASGASEPGALAETFIELERVGYMRVDGLVSVIDADAFDPDDPHFGPLTRAQVKQADLLVMMKLDLVDEARAEQVRAAVRRLHPDARIVDRADVSTEILLGLRDDALPRIAGDQGIDEAPRPAAATFRTGHLRIDRPVSFRTVLPALGRLPAAVVRAKGWLNLLERPGDRIAVHVVGRRVHVRTIDRWADHPNETPRTELVFIGARDGWDPTELTEALRSTVVAPP